MAAITDEAVAALADLVGSPTTARALLQATDGDAEAAANLFFAADGNIDLAALGGGGNGGGGGGDAPPGGAAPGGGLGGWGGAAAAAFPPSIPPGRDPAAAPPYDPDASVRAPLPVITDRLYGDGFAPPARPRRADTRPTEAAAFGEGGGGSGGPGRPPLLPPPGGLHAGGGGGGGGGAAGAGAAAPSTTTAALAGLFEPPTDLLTPGDLGDALGAAAAAGTWLVINVQSNAEFASHRLNRDTWSDPGLRAVLGGGFTFWQACASAEAGRAALARYGLDSGRLPCVCVVDPSTGALAAAWTGWVAPDRLAEELVPFLDVAPADPGAGRLIARCRRRGLHPSGRPGGAAAAGAGAGAGGGGGAGGGAPPAPPPQGPDEERRRLAARAAAAAPPPAPEAAAAAAQEGGPSPAPAPAAAAAAAIQAAAAASLPPEPPADALGAVRLAARLTDGTRVCRVFPGGATLSSVRAWVVSADAAAAAAPLESLTLRPAAGPGGGGGPPLVDWDAPLAGRGLGGALLAVGLAAGT